ncbi:hypothetical protein [Mobiluncus curtisii]|uniref:hypothetical protein n=1 Tax=Mobiluncus curtisii TaxID=2051 RepID=UPI0021E1E612|nr:hypothetical protein [Mobiluncus curtisii]
MSPMKELANQRSKVSRFATLAIIVVLGIATSAVLFKVLGEPVIPRWWAVFFFVILIMASVLAGKQTANVNQSWVYVVDVLLAVLLGIAFLTSQENEPLSGFAAFAWNLFSLLVIASCAAHYLDKRHPKAPKDAVASPAPETPSEN